MTTCVIPSGEYFGQLCMEKYKFLPKTGKPKLSEWTVLSCIIQFNKKTNVSEVVALGTGTKCIGNDQLCPKGLILNDSHAEIIARRAFLRYIYDQILVKNGNSIFTYNSNTQRFNLDENLSFHFFSSYPPCGDASIITNTKPYDNLEAPLNKKARKDLSQNVDNSYDCKKTLTEVFTGAKLICTNKNDLMDQEEGAVRRKPGRGTPTLSMSCSDKIAKWNILGIQGALLDSILNDPIYLSSFTFCSNSNVESISRAFYKRWLHKSYFLKHNNRYYIHKPEIRCCSINLLSEFIASDDKQPSPTSIVWCNVIEKSLEIAISGKRQGITKKNWTKKSSSLNISKVMILDRFKYLLRCYTTILENRFKYNEEDLKMKTYKDLKVHCVEYQTAWSIIKNEIIEVWIKKPENLYDFL